MMYDKDFIKSYINRIEKNYNILEKKSKYDVTALLSSLAGILIVVDDDARKGIFSDVDIPEYIEASGKSDDELFYIDEYKDNGNQNLAIIRHFRNSLCHFKLDDVHIKKNKKNKIKEITFEDFYNGESNFKCCLTVKKIKEFMKFLVKVIKTQ